MFIVFTQTRECGLGIFIYTIWQNYGKIILTMWLSILMMNGEKPMYYVPDGTELCGYYECSDCDNRFLSLQVAPTLVCPYCGEEPNMEIGPDEEMPKIVESARLIKMIEGVEEVEKMDALLSLAITGGDYNWL